MKPAFLLPAALAGAVLALASGCASEASTTPAADPPSSRRVETITGSHIPNKNALPPQSDAEREKTVERMRELQKTSQPVQTKP